MSSLPKCTVVSCSNSIPEKREANKGEVNFFPFPTNPQILQLWKDKCGVDNNFNHKNSKVCSDHFNSNDYIDNTRTVLKPDAVPVENLTWLCTKPNFDVIKAAVDASDQLLEQLTKAEVEQNQLQNKVVNYEKKIDHIQNEIHKVKGLILKVPPKKREIKLSQNLISKVFSQAQIGKLMGKKKVVWSYDDMAMAFTLRHIGNRDCYLYLKNTLNMPLPSLSSVQRWVASNKPLNL